jgi:hypothetical protein
VLTGLVHDPVSGTDKRTLALIVRGTDQVADAYFDYQDFQSHYAKFAPLVQAIHDYLADPAAGIQQALISGHSLGAGVLCRPSRTPRAMPFVPMSTAHLEVKLMQVTPVS